MRERERAPGQEIYQSNKSSGESRGNRGEGASGKIISEKFPGTDGGEFLG